MKLTAALTILASLAAASPAQLEERQSAAAYVPCGLGQGMPYCCTPLIDGLIGQNCVTPNPFPPNANQFAANCRNNQPSQIAVCCVLNLAGLGLLCTPPQP